MSGAFDEVVIGSPAYTLGVMYEIEVERDFSAAHAITIEGRQEVAHRHAWHVSVAVSGSRLDGDGLLCDFHVLEDMVEAIVDRLHGKDLNKTPPFDEINPSAEMVACHIAEGLASTLPDGVVLSRVSVTEAPGCTATYRP
jgi:6-pyruvoyltetrahydropterin/6-carboxytetrahydropterin synthase